MAYIAKVTAGGNSNMLVGNTLYGNCTTAAGTDAKAVTISGFDTLVAGVTIHVRFENANTASSPTLNVSSTGAKPIYKYGTTVPGTTAHTSWQPGSVIALTYNTDADSNGCWVMNHILAEDDILKTGYSHNSIYRGESLGTSVSSAQWASIRGGTFDDMYIGDYWTINSHKYVIAKFYYCSPATTVSRPSVLMLDFSQSDQKMNDTSTTEGGYAGSKMRTFMDETVIPQLDTDFSLTANHVLKPAWYIDNAVTDGIVTGRILTSTEACLLSEVDVWGYRRASAYAHQYGSYYASLDSNNGVGHPIPLISLTGSVTPHGGIGWLRDVCSASHFAFANDNRNFGGSANIYNAGNSYPFRPAFFIY